MFSVGTFVENFSDDVNPSQAGFDSAADGFMFVHDFRAGQWRIESDQSNFYLGSAASGFNEDRVYTTAGPDEEVISIGLRVFGAGTLLFHGDGDEFLVTIPDFSPWQTFTVTRDQPGRFGRPLGPLGGVVIGTREAIFVDDITVVVADSQALPPVPAPGQSGIFIENFSEDIPLDDDGDGVIDRIGIDPNRPGYDSALDGFAFQHVVNGTATLTTGDPGGGIGAGVFLSAPHHLLLSGTDTIPLPTASGVFVNLARVNFFGEATVRFFGTTGQVLTVDSPAVPDNQAAIATNESMADNGLPLGPIRSLQLTGAGAYFDDVVVFINLNRPPGAGDDAVAILPGQTVTIDVLANDVDPENELLMVTGVSNASHGQAVSLGTAVRYVPDPGFQGADTFTYTVADTAGNTATGHVNISVEPPMANDDLAIIPRAQPVDILVLSNDTTPGNDDPLIIVPASPPDHGAAVIHDGIITYTPGDSFQRRDMFTYTIRDDFGNEATATVTIVLNNMPVALDHTFTIPHGHTGPFTVTAPGLLAGATDADGDPVTAVPTEYHTLFGRVSINADGSFTYTADRPDGPRDSTSFDYLVTDGLQNGFAGRITLDVANQPPFVSDIRYPAPHGEPFLIGRFGAGAFDLDGDLLTFTVVQPPEHGFVSISGSVYRYEPYSFIGHVGSDSFTFRADDGYNEIDRNEARVEIIVPNEPPVAGDRSFIVQGIEALESVFTASDSPFDADGNVLTHDPDGDALTYQLWTQPAHGTATLRSDGIFMYVPDGTIFGRDRFTYYVSDGYASSQLAEIEILQGLGRGLARSDVYLAVADDICADIFELDPDALEILAPGVLSNDGFSVRLGPLPPPLIRKAEYVLFSITPGLGAPLVREDGSFSFHLASTISGSDCGFRGYAEFRYRFLYPPPGPLVAAPNTQVPDSELERSNSATVFLYITENPERDSDGIPDLQESQAPNFGDGNGDGRLDFEQEEVASLGNAVDGRNVTLVSQGGPRRTSLLGVRALEPPSPESAPEGVEFPVGVFSFRVAGLLPGEPTTVRLILPAGQRPTTYWKYGLEPSDDPLTTALNERTTDHWYEFLFDGTTGAETHAQNAALAENHILLHFVDGKRGDDDLTDNGVIVDPGAPGFRRAALPTVESVLINNGQAQRSKVNRIKVTFSDAVTLDPGAFAVTRRAGRRNVPVGFRIATALLDGKTVATLTFRGPWTQHGSLRDGDYVLAIRGNHIHDRLGRALDGNADGVPGGKARTEFFRRYGDTDGDRDIDRNDVLRFWNSFGRRVGQRRFLGYLDENNDGVVDGRDTGSVPWAWLMAVAFGRCAPRSR